MCAIDVHGLKLDSIWAPQSWARAFCFQKEMASFLALVRDGQEGGKASTVGARVVCSHCIRPAVGGRQAGLHALPLLLKLQTKSDAK